MPRAPVPRALVTDSCTHDLVIAGGGLVGLGLALAVSGSGLRVVLIDRLPIEDDVRGPDERHLALSEASCRILDALGVLAALGADAEPIRAIHVSSAGEFGAVRWSARQAGRSRFGAVVPARRLLAATQRAVRARGDIELRAPAELAGAAVDGDTIVAHFADTSLPPLRARLLAIADGAESALRSDAGIGATRHDYGRHAICCSLRPERDHAGTGYERFTRSGPVALLPQAGGRCGAVHVVPSEDAARLLALPDREYLGELQAAFGYRLGRLREPGPRVGYPLRRVLAERLTAPRRVLVGNAAQAVHPVGAQGLNLGLRDVAALAERLRATRAAGGDLGSDALLADYAGARAADRSATTGLSHGLAIGTALESAPARLLRSLALLAADRLEPLREHLQLGGMGFRGDSAALTRGAAHVQAA